MKKTFLLFTIPFLLISCDSEDVAENVTSELTEETVVNDPIVGRWSWSKEVYELEDNSIVEIQPSECVSICETEFKADGNVIIITYNEDFDGNCILNSEILEFGTWNKISNNLYEFTSKYENEEEEVQLENIEFVNENQFRYVFDESGGVFNGQNIVVEYEYRVKI